MSRKILKFTVLLLLLSAFFPLQALALEVQSIRFGLYQEKTRLVLDLDRPAEFRTFVLPDPYRMVVDLPAFTWRAENTGASQSGGVLDTRHGHLQPGISRIVFDMNRPVSIQAAFTLPRDTNKPDRLVIDFANVSPSLFQQIKNTVHGTLDTSKAGIRDASLNIAPPPPPKPQRDQTAKPLIILDPGHGGIDPGAIGTHDIHEKTVVLALAKELKKQLEASGQYRVILSREQDHFIKLTDRVKFARKHQGDLFISLHADSLPSKNVSGASVYTLSEKASDEQTAKLAARENKADLIAGIDLNIEDREVANILVDLAMRDTMNQSKFFANTLVQSLKNDNIRILERAHRYAGFAVLKAPDIPSVLIEAGFMSNKKEADMLNTPSHRKRLSRALKKGIDRYFDQVRKNQRI